MDFELNEEQALLQNSVTHLLADRYGVEARRAFRDDPAGWSRELWSLYAEIGMLGIPFEAAHGGLGAGPLEVMLVMQAMGRVLALEPYLSTVVLCGTALNQAGSPAQQRQLVPRIVRGELTMGFAHAERAARYDLACVSTTATLKGNEWIVNGQKSAVLQGDTSDLLLVSARTGHTSDPQGVSVLMVDASFPGVTRCGFTQRDGCRAADISLQDVRVPLGAVLGSIGAGLPIIERVVQAGVAATAAEAIGAMEVVLEMTLEHLKTRRQFGKTIGSNQALQHRAADMFIGLEQARGMALYATMCLEEPDRAERARGLSMAKVAVSEAGRFVSQQGIQLHGGMGVSEEHQVGQYFRRLMVIEHTFGDVPHHLGLLAQGVR